MAKPATDAERVRRERQRAKSLAELSSRFDRFTTLLLRLVSFTAVYVGFAGLILPDFLRSFFNINYVFGRTETIFFILVGSLMMIMPILSGSRARAFVQSLVGVDRYSSEQAMEDLRAKVDQQGDRWLSAEGALSKDAQEDIATSYKKAIKDKFDEDAREIIRNIIREEVKKDAENIPAHHLNSVNIRLQSASSTVTVRGFLNLVLGIAFAVAALVILQQAVSVMTPDVISSLPMSSTVYLIAIRISLALVITLVSYFFLSLYKKSLDDSKFYQNEMTNISSRAAALHLAMTNKDKESLNFVLSKLMDSDRNRLGAASPDDVSNGGMGEVVKGLLDKLPSFKSD